MSTGLSTDTDFERPITFNEAARYLPEGSRPSYATWWRWRTRGLKGIRLRTTLCGGRRCTTAGAVLEFFAAVTAAADGGGSPSPIRTPAQREREIKRAEAEMANGLPRRMNQ